MPSKPFLAQKSSKSNKLTPGPRCLIWSFRSLLKEYAFSEIFKHDPPTRGIGGRCAAASARAGMAGMAPAAQRVNAEAAFRKSRRFVRWFIGYCAYGEW